jgi:hypothetical protein
MKIRRVLPDELIDLVNIYNSSRVITGCFSGGDININAFSASLGGDEIHVASVGVAACFVSVWVPGETGVGVNGLGNNYIHPAHTKPLQVARPAMAVLESLR